MTYFNSIQEKLVGTFVAVVGAVVATMLIVGSVGNAGMIG